LSAALSGSRVQLPYFKPQELSDLLLAFAKLGGQPDEAWLGVYLATAQQKVGIRGGNDAVMATGIICHSTSMIVAVMPQSSTLHASLKCMPLPSCSQRTACFPCSLSDSDCTVFVAGLGLNCHLPSVPPSTRLAAWLPSTLPTPCGRWQCCDGTQGLASWTPSLHPPRPCYPPSLHKPFPALFGPWPPCSTARSMIGLMLGCALLFEPCCLRMAQPLPMPSFVQHPST